MAENELINEIGLKCQLLDVAITQLKKRGIELAKAEREYKVALAKRILDEREKGTPVTIIGDLCRGSREIAELRFKRDCAKTVYESAQEAINGYKLQIRMMDSQVSREWERA